MIDNLKKAKKIGGGLAVRKKRRVRWNRILLLLAVLVLCLSFAVNTFGDVNSEALYVDVTVDEGDSLWSLIHEYNPDFHGNMNRAVYDVKNLNGLDSSGLKAGQIIRLPIDL